jgi:hypothetical protein
MRTVKALDDAVQKPNGATRAEMADRRKCDPMVADGAVGVAFPRTLD